MHFEIACHSWLLILFFCAGDTGKMSAETLYKGLVIYSSVSYKGDEE